MNSLLGYRSLAITDECYGSLVVDQNYFSDAVCLKSTLSKVLGLAIVAGSGALKLPQIYSIIADRSVDGLNPGSLYMAVVSYLASAILVLRKGDPFSAGGENYIITAQNIFIVLLLFVFAKPAMSTLQCARAALAIVGAGVAFCYAPLYVLPILGIVCGCAGRFPQIYQNWSSGQTGQLSFLTWFAQLGGSGVRMFTTLQEINGIFVELAPTLQFFGFVMGAVQNVCVVSQIVWYRGATQAIRAKRIAEEEKKKGS